MTWRTRAAAVALALVAWPAARQASAYLKVGTEVGGQTVGIAWRQMAVHYVVNDATAPGVSPAGFRDALAAAFETWQQVSTAVVRFQFDGFSGAVPLDDDGVNAMGFLSRPDLDRTLAATDYLVDTRTGEILESDIFFNTAHPWSTAPAGEPGRYDVQSIATHEAGHLLGLGHSAIGETAQMPGGRRLLAAGSVMFPIAFAPGSVLSRMLWPDDVAGISDIYPGGGFRESTGSIQGTVTKGGQGVFGTHVVAYSLATGNMIGAFTLDSTGRFVVAGLAPGAWLLRVEPLDDGDPGSFFDDPARVDTEFGVTFYPGIVTVPSGGSAAEVAVKVTAK